MTKRIAHISILLILLMVAIAINHPTPAAAFCIGDGGTCVVGQSASCCSPVCCRLDGTQYTGACAYSHICPEGTNCNYIACVDSDHCCSGTICFGADPANHILGQCE